MRAVLVLVLALLLPAIAHAEDKDGPRSHFTVAFAGGVLVPEGRMADGANASMDVGVRVGWNARNGLGLVLGAEYAPLGREVDAAAGQTDVESHLLAATAGPRFTLGHHWLRVWITADAGLVFERRRTTNTVGETSAEHTEVLNDFVVGGAVGVDLHLFSNGGLTFSGAYTSAVSDHPDYEMITVAGGLVFVI
jgi:hypothetical protein